MVKEIYKTLRHKLNKDDEKWLDLLFHSLEHHKKAILEAAEDEQEIIEKALLNFDATCGITQFYLSKLLDVDLKDVYE
jgi:hypothetical protein